MPEIHKINNISTQASCPPSRSQISFFIFKTSFTMSDRLVTLITGANQGLGYFTAQHLALTGKHHVLVGSRSLEKGEEAVKKLLATNPTIDSSTLSAVQIDISNDDSIEELTSHIKDKYKKLDVLINNAAIGFVSGSARDQWTKAYDTNVSGTALLTESLLPLLKASSTPRIVFVSSSLGSMTIASTAYRGKDYVQYSVTKTALNMLVLHYTNVLKEDEVIVIAICPGHCATNLNGYRGARDPVDGAKGIADAAVEGGMEMSGRFIRDGETVPW
jgi:NAD(P)-dependent dehydrogenase (short-subunit alcohol dehydrogenase family)